MGEQVIRRNKVVHFTYTILDRDGSLLEQYDLPVGYVHGAGGQLLEAIEHALEGHRRGDQVRISIAPEQGFGSHREELTFTDDLENVPPQFRRVGAEVPFENDRGETRIFRVSRIEDGKLTVDGNHPLAGKILTYVVSVVGVRDATRGEITSGVPAEAGPEGLH
ncbi:MAG: FKBP-type peptidyl-prolyl cis-trans isomerase [Betaproteobacteria bacterium]|nr:FKBP-type peptidyl-prolyl cis-trans isomerase [Betaproteobacteria bacterium]